MRENRFKDGRRERITHKMEKKRKVTERRGVDREMLQIGERLTGKGCRKA